MDETDADITAKNILPALGKAACQCRRDGADTCNRRNPKRKTGDENAKPSDAAAQFAPRKPGGKRKGGRLVAHAGAPASIRSTRPSRNRTTRSQRAASASSWVMRTSVALRRA